MKLYIEKPEPCVIEHKGVEKTYTPTRQDVYLFEKEDTKYYMVVVSTPKDQRPRFQDDISRITINLPAINQIAAYSEENIKNLPSGIRNVVLSDQPQYAVNRTFRGRQSMNICSMRPLVAALGNEVTENIVDIYLANEYNIKPTITIRVDINRLNVAKSVIYTKGRKDAPLYATLRFPPELLLITQIIPASRGANEYTYEEEEFESNIIYANMSMGMFAAMAGGGALQGIGTGIGMWAQNKTNMEMQQKYFDWSSSKIEQEYSHRKQMQGDMFDFQSKYQGQNQDFQRMMQQHQFDQQNEYQRHQYVQQDLQQYRQNEFTKELVEKNADSDIRKARTAQQLAGYRTDAAVSNLSPGVGRGGFGHPWAPQGASLPPRSTSTQTTSPKVNIATPSGFYSGPSTSEC